MSEYGREYTMKRIKAFGVEFKSEFPCERQYLTKKDDRPGTCSEMDDKICPVELGENCILEDK